VADWMRPDQLDFRTLPTEDSLLVKCVVLMLENKARGFIYFVEIVSMLTQDRMLKEGAHERDAHKVVGSGMGTSTTSASNKTRVRARREESTESFRAVHDVSPTTFSRRSSATSSDLIIVLCNTTSPTP
jgi:hypothetical protein